MGTRRRGHTKRRYERGGTRRAGAPADAAITAMVVRMSAPEVVTYILGASKDNAAQAYKAASRIFHPDRKGPRASGPDMSIINNAYDVRRETEVPTPEEVTASAQVRAVAIVRPDPAVKEKEEAEAKARAEAEAQETAASDMRNKTALKSDILSEIADIDGLIGRNPRDEVIAKRLVKVLKRAENFWRTYTPPGGQDADAVTIKSAYTATYRRALSSGVKIGGGKRFTLTKKRNRQRYSRRRV